MFEGFDEHWMATDEAEIYFRAGGKGPPLLLLHGYPQNHIIWHAIADRLGKCFSLIIPDLRGYGESKGPEPDPHHIGYSKRAMGAEMVELMSLLGHDRFLLAGHDRGGRVAYRLALDFPERVSKLAVIDIIPTFDVWEKMNKESALGTYHWLFLAQPAPMPEKLIGQNVEFYLRHLLSRWAGDVEALQPEAIAEYIRHFQKPSVIEATCEDYRSGATVDYEHDRSDIEAGRKITCPVLVLWAKKYLSSKSKSPLGVWRKWADDVREVAIDCGHFMVEEQPELCAEALLNFLSNE
jgi:haloacetate dehalogenase